MYTREERGERKKTSSILVLQWSLQQLHSEQKIFLVVKPLWHSTPAVFCQKSARLCFLWDFVLILLSYHDEILRSLEFQNLWHLVMGEQAQALISQTAEGSVIPVVWTTRSCTPALPLGIHSQLYSRSSISKMGTAIMPTSLDCFKNGQDDM